MNEFFTRQIFFLLVPNFKEKSEGIAELNNIGKEKRKED